MAVTAASAEEHSARQGPEEEWEEEQAAETHAVSFLILHPPSLVLITQKIRLLT